MFESNSALRRAFQCAAAATLFTTGFAQTNISGALSDSTTGALTSGVYIVTGPIEVPDGDTLTIDPGAILKFNFNTMLTVNGTLDAQGAPGDPIIFTETRDDVGGDTNGDGMASLPAASWWRSLNFLDGSDASVLSNAQVRFAGRGVPAIDLESCDAVFTNVEVLDSGSYGVSLNASTFPSQPTLTNVSVTRSAQLPFEEVSLRAVPGFSGLTVTDSLAENWMRVTDAALVAGENLEIEVDNCLAGVLFISQPMSLAAGSTLTLREGVALKFGFNREALIEGTLIVDGTAADPVVFTEQRDDSARGDSNGDGMNSAPAAGWWRGLSFVTGSDASHLQHATVRYAGRGVPSVRFAGSDATLDDIIVEDGSSDGIDLATNSMPTIRRAVIRRNSLSAIDSATIPALENFLDLVAVDNGSDWIRVTDGLIPAGTDVTIGPENGIHAGFHHQGNVMVDLDATLTLRAGVITKASFNSEYTAIGRLICEGTLSTPVILTEERDDVGGDSNGDNANSAPDNAWWRGLTFTTDSDGSTLSFANLRFAGRGRAAIDVLECQLTLDRCHIESSGDDGIRMNASTEECSFLCNRITDGLGEAIDQVRLDRVPDFVNTVAFGNADDRMFVTNGEVNNDLTLRPENMVNGTIAFRTGSTVAADATLSLEPGVTLQFGFNQELVVDGAILIDASFDDPVILTSTQDDTVLDIPGTNPGSASFWRGLTPANTSVASTLRGLIIRNGGRGVPQLRVDGLVDELVQVRSERSGNVGIAINVAPMLAERIVAVGCSSDGVQVNVNGAALRQVTAASNSGIGIDFETASSGSIADSISFGNTQDGFKLASASARFCNGTGLTAGDGNGMFDPMFNDLMARDLTLMDGSPSIDGGDPVSPLDPDGTRADQGAYFANELATEVFCTQADNATCLPTIKTVGFASMSRSEPFVVSLLNAPTQQIGLFFYGTGARTSVAGFFGNLCVTNPYARTPVIASGGDLVKGLCDGQFDFDARAYLQSGVDPNLGAGVTMIGAFWHRDATAPGGAKFTEAVEIPIGN